MRIECASNAHSMSSVDRPLDSFNRYRTAIKYLRICAWSAVCAMNYLLRTALFRAYMRGVAMVAGLKKRCSRCDAQ